jgi:flagellar biosynthesis/type III secretory pathway protein FliH
LEDIVALVVEHLHSASWPLKGAKEASPGRKESAMHLEQLIENVESSADWRAEKAEQYPDDTRNMRSSQALTKLAEKLKALPANDENVAAYEAVMSRLVESDGGDEMFGVIEYESQYIGRYGFDYPQDGDPADFLEALTEACQESVDKAEEQAAEEEREQAYEEAKQTASEEAKQAAHEKATEAAKKAAEEAAEEARRQAYAEAYTEAYEEAYREALIEALNPAT